MKNSLISSSMPAASATVTGIPALIIIVLVLAVIVVGIVAIVRWFSRKARS